MSYFRNSCELTRKPQRHRKYKLAFESKIAINTWVKVLKMKTLYVFSEIQEIWLSKATCVYIIVYLYTHLYNFQFKMQIAKVLKMFETFLYTDWF